MHIHFIGIGGTGLSAMAKVMLEQGHIVTGSDRQYSPLMESIKRAGAQVFVGHNPEHVKGADIIVRSSAVPSDNVEVLAGIRAGIPVFKRKDFLHILTEGSLVVAVAGTHGKTTTTAMVAWLLTRLQQSPTFIVGGVINNLKTNAQAGNGKVFVIEADEYDRMFLGLEPDIAVITNIEYDHPDIYHTQMEYQDAFRDFVGQIVSHGVLIGCVDDANTAELLKQIDAQGVEVVSYGLVPHASDYWADEIATNQSGGYQFNFIKGGKVKAKVSLSIPGLHNVQNALGALIVVDQLSLPLNEAADLLGEFSGTGRRFEVRGEVNQIVIVDDYAHHPTEIKTTVRAAKAKFPGKRLWVVWQPHTYTRTINFYDEFKDAFHGVDHLIVTDVYAAREKKPKGFSIGNLVKEIKASRAVFMPNFSEIVDYLMDHLTSGDVLLVLSAGDAIEISESVLKKLEDVYGDMERKVRS